MKMKKLTATVLALIMVLSMVTIIAPAANAAKSGDYEYTVSGGKATITNYTGKGGNVTIPAKLGGYPVTEIGWVAFGYNNELNSVTIPGSVKIIAEEAFSFCQRLSEVTICDGVTTIESLAFFLCESLSSVTIPKSVTTIGDWAFAESRQVKINCYNGSYAETFAQKAGIPFTLLEADTYTVKFNKNGGSGTMKNQTITIGKSTKLTANSFTRKSYAFSGWNTKKDGSGTKYTNKKSVKNLAKKDKSITLYAQWTKVSAPTKAVTSLKLTAPAAKQLKVTYKAVSGANGYRIEYSTSKSFTKATTKSVHTTKLTYTIKSLTAQKTYYVRVTAYKTDSTKTKIYSSKTATKSLKTK